MSEFSVLDACALLAYAKSEPGGDIVLDIMTDPARRCVTHAVNMCEAYYHFLRAFGQATADSMIKTFADAGVIVREDLDMAFWRQVGQNKVSFTLALGDCFCLALA